MNDLISRNALIAEYDRVHIGPPGGARKLMEDAPSVNIADVPHWATEQAYKNGYEQGKKDAADNNVDRKWISVKDRLPEYGQLVIVYSGGVLSPHVFAQHFWREDFNDWAHITHWMPLPQPPKGE
jgi:hypothetical protein